MKLSRLLAAFAVAAAFGCASTPRARIASDNQLVPVGVSHIDITPEEPIRLTGYGNRVAPSDAVRQRLWAKALAFGNDQQRPAVLITADLIGVPHQVTDEVARRLRNARIERAQLAITATHTHTGPTVSPALPYIFGAPIPPEQQAVIDRYSAQLVDKLERVARRALADRRPSRMAWAQGSAGFAANRRVLKDGKWAAFGVQPGGPVDHDLPLLVVHAPDGVLRAVLVNYACHATTLEGKDNFVHGDWPGAAQELIQKRHPGAVAMVTIGTGADSNPNPRGGGLADVERHGQEVANEVDRLLGTTLRPVTAPPVGRFRSLNLALARVPSRREWEQQAKGKGAAAFFARSVLERLDRGEQLAPTAAYPVQTWAFANDLVMVFLGGEVVADYGLRLKRELDASRLWVNAYSNDVAFYVASRRMIPEGGYEVVASMVYYGQPAPLADGTEEQIIAAVKALIPRGFLRP